MSKKSPTARTLELLRERGYELVQVVEHRVPYTRITRDLFGIIDVLAVGIDTDGRAGVDILGVQCTSSSNAAARVNKITESDALPILRKASIRVVVHGWRKSRPSGTWVCREVDLS